MIEIEDISVLITFARKFRNLGDAIGDQLDAVLVQGADADEQNANALERGAEVLNWLRRIAGDEDGDLADAIAQLRGEA